MSIADCRGVLLSWLFSAREWIMLLFFGNTDFVLVFCMLLLLLSMLLRIIDVPRRTNVSHIRRDSMTVVMDMLMAMRLHIQVLVARRCNSMLSGSYLDLDNFISWEGSKLGRWRSAEVVYFSQRAFPQKNNHVSYSNSPSIYSSTFEFPTAALRGVSLPLVKFTIPVPNQNTPMLNHSLLFDKALQNPIDFICLL